MTQPFFVNLDHIEAIDGLKYRELDKSHVESLVAMNEPDTWPPIIVTVYNQRYGLIAGQHRMAAAFLLKRKSIQAEVHNYPSLAAMSVAMWEDNARHGMNYTAKEKKEHALALHQAHPNMSLNEIGRRAGLTHQTVKSAIQAAQKTSTGNAEYDSYSNHNRNSASRLKTALIEFFKRENARLFLAGGTSQRDAQHRALLLAQNFKGEQDAIAMLNSLAQACQQAAALLTPKKKGA